MEEPLYFGLTGLGLSAHGSATVKLIHDVLSRAELSPLSLEKLD
jgi:hypothetical protein